MEECGEEALEDVLNLIAGTDGEERSLENFANAIFKSPEEWAVITGSILIQGGGLSAANYLIANNMAQRGKTKEEIQETIDSISQTQASDIIDNLIKNKQMNIAEDVRLTDEDKRRSIEIKEEIKQKLIDVNVKKEEAEDLAILTAAMYERYGTRNGESRDVFNRYMDNLQIKYNVPSQEILKGKLEYNQDIHYQEDSVNNPLNYDYINHQVTGEKIALETNPELENREDEIVKPKKLIDTKLNLLRSSDNDIKNIKSNIKQFLFGKDKTNTTVKNKNTNINATIFSSNIDEMVHKANRINIKKEGAREKRAEFYNIIANAKHLFENSEYILSYNEAKKESLKNNQKIHRYANVVNSNNNEYIVIFTIQENKNRNTIKIYDLENFENKNSSGELVRPKGATPSRTNISIAQLRDFVKSRVVEKYNNDYKDLQKENKNKETYYQEITPEDKQLIAGYTVQEMFEKLGQLYEIQEQFAIEGAKQAYERISARIHILEDAIEASQKQDKINGAKLQELYINAYYVMNNEDIPESYIDTDKKSERSYRDYKRLHEERKEKEEARYRGYFSKAEGIKPTIAIMQEQNASTALHEFAHMFLDLLNEMAKVNPDARVQLEAVNSWLNYTGEYTRAQHEKFADNFVAYLYKGKAPNSKLKTVFENFKEWLKTVYRSVLDIPNFEMSKEVEELFDNIFGTDSFVQEQKQAKNLLKEVKSKAKMSKSENFAQAKELDETGKRHKEVSYEILAAATGKNEKYLKTIFEGNAKGAAKKREAILKLIDETADKIYIEGGMREEWKEFYSDSGVNFETEELGGGYRLASAALDTILNKRYKSEDDVISQLDERAQYYENVIDEADREYRLLMREYKKAAKEKSAGAAGQKETILAAMCDWIDELDSQIKKDYEDRFICDSAMIDREINVNKFDVAKRAIIKRALEVENQYKINKDEKYREVVKEIMKNLNFLNPSDKARLTANILDIGSCGMLMGRINQILDVAHTMEDVSYRRRLEKEIHKELQGTKNVKKSGKATGKYDYRTNKLFEKLRELDKLSSEKADELRLGNKRFIDAEDKPLGYREKLINKFLSYKAAGRTYEDTDLMKELYDEIVRIKFIGKSAKSELELNEKLNNEQDADELLNILSRKKKAKFTAKFYNECFGNIESTVNLIFNKKIKEKYASEILYASTQASTWAFEQKKKIIEGIAKIYNLPKWKWDSTIIKYLSEKFTFDEIRRKYNEEGELVKTRIIPREMSKMDILNAYIQSRNEVGEQRLINQFGQDTLDSMFDELSLQDVALAELLMDTVQSNYGLVNKTYIKRYGIDLPRVSNYFPFTPERMDDVNNYNEYQAQSYSFIKSRSASVILPMDFHNPLDIVFSHIENVSKFIYMSESIDKANKLFKNPDIKRAIISKYGNGGYRTLEQELLNIGNRKQAEIYNGFQKVIDRITSNWLLANVMVKPITGLKQLLSANNYAIDMPFVTWQKGFLKGIANYKETIDYMMKIPYLKARFGSGFSNEALKQTIENSKYAQVQSLKNLLTLNIRLGDIGAIIFGGKPYIDYLIKEKGMEEDEAIKQFILSTNRSQQSSEVSSLSNFQVDMSSNTLLKIMTSYRNAQQQYVRMCGDAIVSVANGDMTKQQCAKVLFNYGFFQPFIFALATSGSLLRGLLTGDWDDFWDDFKLSIFNLGSDSLAFFGDVYRYAVQRLIAANKFTLQGYSMALFDEIMNEINRVSKEDVELSDWLYFTGTIAGKPGIGIDINQNIGNSIFGAASDIIDGEVLQGSLRALGMTEKRAKHIVGND